MKLEPIRKGLNAKLFKSLWVDWDAGPEKVYKTSKDAAIALNKFLADTGLPKPPPSTLRVGRVSRILVQRPAAH